MELLQVVQNDEVDHDRFEEAIFEVTMLLEVDYAGSAEQAYYEEVLSKEALTISLADSDQRQLVKALIDVAMSEQATWRRVPVLSALSRVKPWFGLGPSIGLLSYTEYRESLSKDELRQLLLAIDTMLNIVYVTEGDEWSEYLPKVMATPELSDLARVIDAPTLAAHPRVAEVASSIRSRLLILDRR